MERKALRQRLIEAVHERECGGAACFQRCRQAADLFLSVAIPELEMILRTASAEAALKARNKDYGRASATIGALRGDLARARADRASERQYLSRAMKDREILAVYLGLPRNASMEDLQRRAIELASQEK